MIMFDIFVTVGNICKYIRIKWLSSVRLFFEIPFIYKLVMAVFAGLGGFLLLSLDLQINAKSMTVCICIFVLLGVSICSFSFREKILLKTIGVKIFAALFIRLLLLSIPFFLLDIYIGLIAGTAGSLCVILLQGVNIRKSKRLPSFYRKTSYQWLSSFRRGGLWVLIIGFLLFAIALYHGNENMMSAAFGWLMCVPCLMSYFNIRDSRFWLANYNSVHYMLKSKLLELFVNASLPALICLFLVAIFMPVHLLLFVKLSTIFLFVDLLIFYCVYLNYPLFIMAFINIFIIISVLLVVVFMHPVLSIYISAPLLLVLHVLAVQNLKSEIYDNFIS